MKEYYKIYAKSECPYCIKAREFLLEQNKSFMFCSVGESEELLNYFKDFFNWMTVPIIVHYKRESKDKWSKEFIGGYTDLITSFGVTDD